MKTSFGLRKEGPPVYVEIYVDGRAYARTPSPCTRREYVLFQLFKKGVDEGEIRNIKPGRYTFNFTKVGLFGTEAELSPISD